jgi:serine/threonine-protein kinase
VLAAFTFWPMTAPDRVGAGPAAPGPSFPAASASAILPGTPRPTPSDPRSADHLVSPNPAGPVVPAPGTTTVAPFPPPLTTPAPVPPTTAGPTETFNSEGGSVTATCTRADQAKLLSWTPARGFHVDSVAAGPADTAFVVFMHGQSSVRLSVTCQDWQPSAS